MAHIVRSEKLPGSKVRPCRTESRWNKHTRKAKADSLSVFDKGEAGLACVQNILALTCIFVVSVGWFLVCNERPFTLIFFYHSVWIHSDISQCLSEEVTLTVPVHKADPQHLLKAHYRSTITITSCCLPEVRADGLLFLSLIFFFLLKILTLTLAWILSHPQYHGWHTLHFQWNTTALMFIIYSSVYCLLHSESLTRNLHTGCV